MIVSDPGGASGAALNALIASAKPYTRFDKLRSMTAENEFGARTSRKENSSVSIGFGITRVRRSGSQSPRLMRLAIHFDTVTTGKRECRINRRRKDICRTK